MLFDTMQSIQKIVLNAIIWGALRRSRNCMFKKHSKQLITDY